MKINLSISLLLTLSLPLAQSAPHTCDDGVIAYSTEVRCDENNFTLVDRSCNAESITTLPCSEYSEISSYQYCHMCEFNRPVCSDINDAEAVCSDVNANICDSVNYETGDFYCASDTEALIPWWVCNNGTKQVFDDDPDSIESCADDLTLNAEASMCLRCGSNFLYCTSQGQTCESIVSLHGGGTSGPLTSSAPSVVGALVTLWVIVVAAMTMIDDAWVRL